MIVLIMSYEIPISYMLVQQNLMKNSGQMGEVGIIKKQNSGQMGEGAIFKRHSAGFIHEVTRKRDKEGTYTYRKLHDGLQFGGTLDGSENGDGIIVNYNDEYYLLDCTITRGVVVKYSGKYNLITREMIHEEPAPLVKSEIHEKLQQLTRRLYQEYLNREIQHKILVSFTTQTDQFFQQFKSNQLKNINQAQSSIMTTNLGADHYNRFRKAYQSFTNVLVSFGKDSYFAVVINKEQAYLFSFCLDIQKQNSIIEFLEKAGFKVIPKEIVAHKLAKKDVSTSLELKPTELKSSGSTKSPTKQTTEGYYIILLVAKLFQTNSLEKSKDFFDQLVSEYFESYKHIEERVLGMANKQIVISPLETIFTNALNSQYGKK